MVIGTKGIWWAFQLAFDHMVYWLNLDDASTAKIVSTGDFQVCKKSKSPVSAQ